MKQHQLKPCDKFEDFCFLSFITKQERQYVEICSNQIDHGAINCFQLRTKKTLDQVYLSQQTIVAKVLSINEQVPVCQALLVEVQVGDLQVGYCFQAQVVEYVNETNFYIVTDSIKQYRLRCVYQLQNQQFLTVMIQKIQHDSVDVELCDKNNKNLTVNLFPGGYVNGKFTNITGISRIELLNKQFAGYVCLCKFFDSDQVKLNERCEFRVLKLNNVAKTVELSCLSCHLNNYLLDGSQVQYIFSLFRRLGSQAFQEKYSFIGTISSSQVDSYYKVLVTPDDFMERLEGLETEDPESFTEVVMDFLESVCESVDYENAAQFAEFVKTILSQFSFVIYKNETVKLKIGSIVELSILSFSRFSQQFVLQLSSQCVEKKEKHKIDQYIAKQQKYIENSSLSKDELVIVGDVYQNYFRGSVAKDGALTKAMITAPFFGPSQLKKGTRAAGNKLLFIQNLGNDLLHLSTQLLDNFDENADCSKILLKGVPVQRNKIQFRNVIVDVLNLLDDKDLQCQKEFKFQIYKIKFGTYCAIPVQQILKLDDFLHRIYISQGTFQVPSGLKFVKLTTKTLQLEFILPGGFCDRDCYFVRGAELGSQTSAKILETIVKKDIYSYILDSQFYLTKIRDDFQEVTKYSKLIIKVAETSNINNIKEDVDLFQVTDLKTIFLMFNESVSFPAFIYDLGSGNLGYYSPVEDEMVMQLQQWQAVLSAGEIRQVQLFIANFLAEKQFRVVGERVLATADELEMFGLQDLQLESGTAVRLFRLRASFASNAVFRGVVSGNGVEIAALSSFVSLFGADSQKQESEVAVKLFADLRGRQLAIAHEAFVGGELAAPRAGAQVRCVFVQGRWLTVTSPPAIAQILDQGQDSFYAQLCEELGQEDGLQVFEGRAVQPADKEAV